MDNQHKKITGYRDLLQAEIDAMNGIKALEATFNGMIDHLKTIEGVDGRQVALAATHGEDAFMHAVRAVAQPERKSAPFPVAVVAPGEGMARYLGMKLVNAKPMTRADYNELRGWELPGDENGDDAGYLVEYADGQRPNVDGFAGYVSWSPADVFEAAYR